APSFLREDETGVRKYTASAYVDATAWNGAIRFGAAGLSSSGAPTGMSPTLIARWRMAFLLHYSTPRAGVPTGMAGPSIDPRWCARPWRVSILHGTRPRSPPCSPSRG